MEHALEAEKMEEGEKGAKCELTKKREKILREKKKNI